MERAKIVPADFLIHLSVICLLKKYKNRTTTSTGKKSATGFVVVVVFVFHRKLMERNKIISIIRRSGNCCAQQNPKIKFQMFFLFGNEIFFCCFWLNCFEGERR